MTASPPLLDVRDLRLAVGDPDGPRPVDGVSFTVAPDEVFGVVGESGSGKTLTTRAILQLLPPGVGVIGGSVQLRGRELLGLTERELNEVRGRRIALIPQHAGAALNPLVPVGRQVAAALRAHGTPRSERDDRVNGLLEDLGLRDPRSVARRYPHELSGGMQQRVVAAAALAAEPELLIADEPTSALDPLVQLQFLDLLAQVQAQRRMAVILVTHDLGVVARLCDRVLVMYGGRVMEQADTTTLFAAPRHPYTEGLLRATPDPYRSTPAEPIPGRPLQASVIGDACPFAPRCPHVHDRCRTKRPPMFPTGPGHGSACWLAEDSAASMRNSDPVTLEG